MLSPLEIKKIGSRSKPAGTLLYAVLCVFILLCAVSTLGQGPANTAVDGFYPQTLEEQLQKIVESSAEEVDPLRKTCAAILDDLKTTVVRLENNPAEPCPELQRLVESVKTLEMFRESWTTTVSVEQPYVPSAVALEEISLAVKRRIFVWRGLFTAAAAAGTPVTTLYGKSLDDIERLRERTLAVEQYFTRSRRSAEYKAGLTWREYLETQSWLAELEACRQPDDQQIRLVSLSAPLFPVEILTMLSHRANTTVHRLESPTLTNEQRAFLDHPTVSTWKEELQSWTADIVTPIHILRLLDQHEATGGMSDMKALSQFIDQLSTSKTPEYRQLGDNVRRQYGMANVRLFLSCALLSNHLPPAVSEIAAFREVIQSQPTVGRRQTETELAVSFMPHPTRVLTSLDIGVDLATVSRSDAFATSLFNTGRTLIIAKKTIELTEQGFLTEPCEARIVGHQMRLVRMDTDFDRLPILSGLFRDVVRGQYESRFPGANTETQRKILRQVRSQIDRETEQRLQPINDQIRTLSQYADAEFGLQVEQRESRTDENWLLTAWGIRGKGTLSSSTPAPETRPGTFADLKIHESLPNVMIGKLGLEGKRDTIGGFKAMLAEKFQMPDLAAPEENDELEVTFASHNPLVVRFVDNRIELTISITSLRLTRRTHRDFQVIVRYKPGYDSEGRLVLERDGYISLPNVVREQVIMRAAFGKIFPVSRPFPLVPKVLETDPQFDYLTTGHCRIEKGWFALALIEKLD